MPTFTEWLAARGYRNWCVAQRMTDRLRHRGYDQTIHPTTYRKLVAEHEVETGTEAARIAEDYRRRYGVELAAQLAKVRP